VLLADGREVAFDGSDPLAGAEWVVVVEHDGDPTRARVREAAVIDEATVRLVAGGDLEERVEVRWDARRGDVVARAEERFGAVTVRERPLDDPPPDAVAGALLDGLRAEGLGLLGWDDDARRLQARLGFLHRLDPERWPDVSDDALLADAERRIAPLLVGARRARDLRRVDVREVLLAGLDWHRREAIDELAPERLAVPSGNRHRVDYTGDPPVLAVKLQELFGSTETPAVGGGRVPVVLHLLSPAGRPLQVTQDLASFWAGAYAQVRADMRGRYPKHPWPEDPAAAVPTARTRRRG
jgi:ATP-dependent helicase HrpB